MLRDGTWTDIRFEPSLHVIEVAPYSAAYFELVEVLPALKQYLALGEQVIIAGDGVALQLATDGITDWKSRDLRAVLDGFEDSF